MNSLPRPPFDDRMALTLVANDDDLKSYNDLNPILPNLLEAYNDYEAMEGNALAIDALELSKTAALHLKKLYKSPVVPISYINEMRELTDYIVCPMCGSTHSGTLDHLLPQHQHPEFSIFSQNLVPACKCNSLRKNSLIGEQPGERILHPYFDECLTERLIAADFSDLGKVPRVEVKIVVPSNHPDYPMINYHVRTVVAKTGITRFLRAEWNKLLRKPGLFLSALKFNPASSIKLSALLEEERDRLDENHESRNNWHSVYVSGLLDPTVTQWLFNRFVDPARKPGGPLLPSVRTNLWPANKPAP